MLTWYRNNRAGALGILACLLFGGIELMVLLSDGAKRADLNSPAGVLVQAIASQFTDAPSPVRVGTDRRELTYKLYLYWQVLLTFAVAVLMWMAYRARRGSRRARAIMLVQMTLGAMGISGLLYVLAAQLAVLLPFRQGIRYLVIQMGLLVATFVYMLLFRQMQFGDDLVRLIAMYGGIGLLFQVLTFAVAHVAVRERATRLKLAAANASLLATQSMLADTVRSSERTRIARDLHDAVGHHLTALNLHLDLALRQAGQDASAPLHTSRELARSLLSEVRVVVSSERIDQRIDLGAAIATMCAGIPAPAIVLRIEDSLEIASAAVAHTLFFCTQEALTNAIRHSGARAVTIDLQATGDKVRLRIGDDGHGTCGAREGNGLLGMRERVAELGGTLAALDRAGRGFDLDISLPLAGSAA